MKNGSAKGSALSSVAYLEVLNPNNVSVKQLKIHLDSEGRATTRFILPDTLSTANYRLRGYTKWMRNYNADFYFNKTISVINPFVNKTFPKGDRAFNNDTVIFYPEGGHVFSGAKNSVIFQSFNAFANGKAMHGYIVSQSGDTVTTVKSNANGIGKFSFEPENDSVYEFCIDTNGEKLTLPLPQIQTSGYGIHLSGDETTLSLEFEIIAPGQAVDGQKKGFIHIATRDGEFLKSYPVRINKHERIVVEKGDLPNSILFASLIDNSGEVLSGRYFKFSDSPISAGIEVKTDKPSYSTREPVNVNIMNVNGLSDVSISVAKSCLLNDTPGIVGYSGLPNQSLSRWQTGDISMNDMLICFRPIKGILANAPYIPFLPEIEGEIISGTIIEKDSNKPLANKSFILSFVGKTPTIVIAPTDSLGRFNFIANRYGEKEIVIQPFSRDTSDLNYSINLDMAFSDEYSSIPLTPLYMDSNRTEAVNQAIINMQVNAIYRPYNSYPVKPSEPKTAPPFYGKPESTIPIDHFIELPTIEDVIREIVPYVYLRRDKGEYYFHIYDASLNYQKDEGVFSLVDGVPVWDTNRILNINPEVLDRIEVIILNYYLHSYNLGGILSFFTKQGDMSSMEFDKRIFRQSQQCYSYNYDFNSPDYSIDSVNISRIPDYRNLLYWNPEISFGEDSRASVTFYTSDEISDYTIVLEGLDAEGCIRRVEYLLEVK